MTDGKVPARLRWLAMFCVLMFAALATRLSRLLKMPVRTLVARVNDPRYYVYTPVPVASDVPKAVAFQIAEHPDLFPGVTTPLLPVRTYPEGDQAAQVLGYTGEISAAQLKEPAFHGYEQGDIVGQTGAEAAYERWLQGIK